MNDLGMNLLMKFLIAGCEIRMNNITMKGNAWALYLTNAPSTGVISPIKVNE